MEAGAVTRERVSQLTVLGDGTCAALVRVRGDLQRLREQSAERSDVLSYSVSEDGDGSGTAYIRTRPPAAVERLAAIPREHAVLVDFPLEAVGADAVVVTMVGEDDATLRAALDSLPDGVETTVRRVGPSPPEDDRVSLTERQREVVTAALELGYYDSPRRATHEAVAERVGLAPVTVTEHLQKAETRVFTALFDG
jgi:hypothetical protein